MADITTDRSRLLAATAGQALQGRETPFLLLRPEAAAAAARRFLDILPCDARYAAKANPHACVLRAVVREGMGVDAASVPEIDAAIAAGTHPGAVSYGNTLKREADIAAAHLRGVGLFAADSADELGRIARAAPGSRVYVRLDLPPDGAAWPLSGKFGCTAGEAPDLFRAARELGLKADGLSFHVGSQQGEPAAFTRALDLAATVARRLRAAGLADISLVNAGGGFPVAYRDPVPNLPLFAEAVRRGMNAGFPPGTTLMTEPGRWVAAPAGMAVTRVLAVAVRRGRRWCYLDLGRFGGLAEAEGEAIPYEFINLDRRGDESDFVVAGPTCDGADVICEHRPARLPVETRAGDLIAIPMSGAYTAVYASHSFNGMPGLSMVAPEDDEGDGAVRTDPGTDLAEVRQDLFRVS